MSYIKRFIINHFPFLIYLKRMRDYTRWISSYKESISNDERYYSFYDEMHREAMKIRMDNHVSNSQAPKPLVIITTYNDHDIIQSIIEENIKSGLEIIIIDNWSSDGTWGIVEKIYHQSDEVLKIMRYPFDGPTDNYQWKNMLDLKAKIALDYKNRWIIHQDSDEITISPIYNFNLAEVLSGIKSLGFNCVSLRMLDFSPIDNEFKIGNPVDYFRYYSISQIPSYLLQNKIWYQGDELVDLSCMGGHDVKFDGRVIFPIRLPRLHYSVRSVSHANSKYSPKRLERSAVERETLGWHTHIDIKTREEIVKNKNELIEFNFESLYSSHFSWFINYESNQSC